MCLDCWLVFEISVPIIEVIILLIIVIAHLLLQVANTNEGCACCRSFIVSMFRCGFVLDSWGELD